MLVFWPLGLVAMGGCISFMPARLDPATGELSKYFASMYMEGELFQGSKYKSKSVDQVRTFRYWAPDGPVFVWQHALDLRDPAVSEDVIILYHYSNYLCFQNVANEEQSVAELFASFVESRAHFGQGVYATQHEPSVWGSSVRILLNSYSNENPLRALMCDRESQRVLREWGDDNPAGHRAEFCVPLIVPKSMAYSIFERQTPDLQARNVPLGSDYKCREVHRNRDVWVVRIEGDKGVKNAEARSEMLLNLLQLRLSKLKQRHGDDSEDALKCMQELASRLKSRGRFDEAEMLYREHLAVRRLKLGNKNKATVRSIDNLITLLFARNKLEEAEVLCREAMQTARELQLDLSTSRNLLASLLFSTQRLDEAEMLFRECLQESRADRRDSLLLDGTSTTWQWYWRPKAEAMFRQCLQTSRDKLGDGHPQTLTFLASLARVMKNRGSPHDAEELYREAFQSSRAALGEGNQSTLINANCLAELLIARGNLEEAEPLLQECLQLCRTNLGNLHPCTVEAVQMMAGLLCTRGQFEKAEPLVQEALQAYRIAGSDTDADTLRKRCYMGRLLQGMGRLDEAQLLLRECLQKAQTSLGDKHIETLRVVNELCQVLYCQGQVAEALVLLKDCLPNCRAILDSGNPDSLAMMNNMATLLFVNQHVDEAELLLLDCLQHSRASQGNAHKLTQNFVKNLAKMYFHSARFDKAEPLFREFLQYCRETLGDTHPETEDAIRSIDLTTANKAKGKLNDAGNVDPHLGDLPNGMGTVCIEALVSVLHALAGFTFWSFLERASVQDFETPFRRVGMAAVLWPDPKEELSNTEAVRLRQCYIRDNVAFLLGRAPDTSHPPVELKMLEMATPRSLGNVASATKDCHGLAAIEGADRLDGLYTRKRDRVTEYMEILMQQSHLVRKK
ncbi:nphp3 [Symbiodinium sp. CCMP2456]|nr:nphp3 [Symbiodinium sp. CCMP2456]